MDPIILSRIQFALTLSFHILFPAFTIGMASYLVWWEGMWLKTSKPVYYQLCRFWGKLFALAFGLGVVSGLVLSYEFGTNFSRFSEVAGNVLGPLMSYEVLSAFFLEAGFLGIMLFGWNRVPRAMHYFATIMVAVGTIFSAFWILSANSWMQTPAGYEMRDGILHVANWWQVIFNPSFPYRFMHMVMASFVTATFVIIGVGGWYLLHKRELLTAKTMFSTGLIVALIITPLQIFLGDMHGLNTLAYQPIKIAAMEGRWETARGASLTLFAIPDPKEEKNNYAIEIPKLGSIILAHGLNGEIKGLKSVSPQDRPYVPLVFFSFRIMVGIGFLFLGIALTGLWLRFRKNLFDTSWFHRLTVFTAPLGFVAIVTGWFTTETGRQPWVIYGLMRTRDGATILPAHEVLITLIVFILIYALLLVTFLYYFHHVVKKGPSAIKVSEEPDHLTAWVEEDGSPQTVNKNQQSNIEVNKHG